MDYCLVNFKKNYQYILFLIKIKKKLKLNQNQISNTTYSSYKHMLGIITFPLLSLYVTY